jgi:hypothetical protein
MQPQKTFHFAKIGADKLKARIVKRIALRIFILIKPDELCPLLRAD